MNKIQDAIKDICGSISVNTIYPEAPVKFDDTRGPRHHDLAFFSDDKKVFVSVEAKVEETFGQTIKAWLKGGNSEDRKIRRDSLMGFFGVDDDSLYNQLLFGFKSTITGVLSTAGNEISLNNGVDYHIMLVLVFVTPDANLNKIEKNKEKFDEFVKAINATKVDSCTSCECYTVKKGKNNFIAYKMVEYPVKCGQ